MAAEPEPEVIEPGPGAKPRRPRKYRPPKLALLERSRSGVVDESSAAAAGEGVVRALEEHGVETRLTGMVVGPTVTRYELELGPGVKVSKVKNLADDIAYAMAASGGVRILAPVPGKRAVGVEVPNEDRRLVTLGDILNSREAKAARHPLEVAVGKDINGNAVMANLAEMPHVLVAGATGAGKSSCINCLLTSILLRSRPDEVRMILIDPKRVELGQYNGLPHLLTQVVDKPKKAANALAWAVREMERRYDLLSDARFRDITGYNEAYDSGELRQAAVEAGFIDGMVDVDTGKEKYPRLPFILIVVDELNDLMMVAARDVEDSIMRIAQMARAVGIHLIIATQRPSRDVITGVIKANIPARWALAVSSAVDSRVIMDQIGAERLVGRGDMLLLDGKSSVPTRVQGAWVTESEVRSIVDAWRAQVSTDGPGYDEEIQGSEEGSSQGSGGSVRSGGDDEDDLLDEARELVVRSGLGSTSMLQRKLRVGFARAGRLMDLLENEGVVGPSEGSKAREVQMTVEELEAGVEPGSGVGAPSGGSPSAPSQGPNSPDTPTLDEGPHLGIAQPPQSIGSEPGPASSGHPSAHRAPPSELR